MKTPLSAILFLLLTASVIHAQVSDESPAKIVPTESKSPAASTARKRPDLNNLTNLTGQKAPNFIAADMNGTEYNLENLRGKIVVINLWATWCKPCIEEMPELNGLVNKFKDRKDVVFLAAAPEDKTLLQGFLQKNPFSYHILPGALPVIRQYSPKEKVDSPDVKPRMIQVLPTHIVIDREGMTVKHIWGFTNRKIPELSQTIEQLLAAKNGV